MTEQHSVRTRRAIPFYWWQQEREVQLRRADELAQRRADHAVRAEEHHAEPLPAAG